jgi:hypothetical protein
VDIELDLEFIIKSIRMQYDYRIAKITVAENDSGNLSFIDDEVDRFE